MDKKSKLVICFILVLLIGSYASIFEEISFPSVILTFVLSLAIFSKLYKLIPFEEHFPTPFFTKNSSPSTVVERSVYLFNLAQKEIFIVSGELEHDFYDNKKVITAIEKALRKKVVIKIICEKPIDKETNDFLKLFSENGNAQILKSRKKLKKHLMVIDGIHVRIEKGHEDNKWPAYFFFDNAYLGKTAKNKFEEYMNHSQRVNI